MFIIFNTGKYITYNTVQNKYLFRYGGLVRKIHDDYIVLAGKNNKTFTVQRYNKKNDTMEPTKFYKTHSKYDNLLTEHEELKEKSEEIFNKQDNLIKEQNKEILKLRKIIKSLNT